MLWDDVDFLIYRDKIKLFFYFPCFLSLVTELVTGLVTGLVTKEVTEENNKTRRFCYLSIPWPTRSPGKVQKES
jgi:hypothetical protein